MECPACNSTKARKIENEVYECKTCLAIYSDHIYLGDSYNYVLPYWDNGNVPAEKTRYFDFICLGSKGIERRHGWYNPDTKRITQTG